MNKKENIESVLPPFKEPYELSENNKLIIDRFLEELKSRTGTSVAIVIYKENLLAYPSLHSDTVKFEVRIGNWHRVMSISEFELDATVGGSFYYFCRRIIDDTMADLIQIGAARA
jgi:hypothetical protein